MKIALVQFQSCLANFMHNANRHLDFIKQAKTQNADLVIFPELSLFSYPFYDLPANRSLFKEQNLALDFICKNLPKDIYCLIGALSENKNTGKFFFNSAFLLSKNKKIQVFSKKLIPDYDIFDEQRFIQAADQDLCSSEFSINDTNFLLHICEDSWFGIDQFHKRSLHSVSSSFVKPNKAVDYVINMSASPFFQGKKTLRLDMAKNLTNIFNADLLYVNSVGSSDEIIFDGRSFVYSKKNHLILEAASFKEDILFFDTKNLTSKTVESKVSTSESNTSENNTSESNTSENKISENKTSESNTSENKISENKTSASNTSENHLTSLRQALCFGLFNFIKQSGFTKVHLGLSGGVDSALVACLAVESFGSENVNLLSLAGPFSSKLSFDLAQEQANLLNIKLQNLSINNLFNICKTDINAQLNISTFSVIHENMQARLRNLILMAYSQHTDSLLLSTSNKSEMAVGYSTLYGDLSGALCPIADLLKTEVYALAKYYQKRNLLPEKIITRPPTAELKENQLDQDSLPDYQLLDFCIMNILNIKKSFILNEYFDKDFLQHIKTTYTKEQIQKAQEFCQYKMDQTEFKRFQSPPILKVSEKSFGSGRRMPINQ